MSRSRSTKTASEYCNVYGWLDLNTQKKEQEEGSCGTTCLPNSIGFQIQKPTLFQRLRRFCCLWYSYPQTSFGGNAYNSFNQDWIRSCCSEWQTAAEKTEEPMIIHCCYECQTTAGMYPKVTSAIKSDESPVKRITSPSPPRLCFLFFVYRSYFLIYWHTTSLTAVDSDPSFPKVANV